MKFIKKCPTFLLIAASGLLFTLTGIIGRFSVYSDYDFDVVRAPFLSLMLDGMSRGTAPWEIFYAGEAEEVLSADAEIKENGGQHIEDVVETEVAAEIAEDGEAQRQQPGEEMTVEEEVSAKEADMQQETEADISWQNDAANPSPEENQAVSGTTETGNDDNMTYNFQNVTEDYFNDAVFIGDSRTVGLFEYAGMEDRADFFAKISLTIYDVFTEPVARDEETGKKITVEEALSKKQYGKVYLMLGINELGTGNTESFMKEYRAVVEKLRQLQPDAVIFVQGIMRVTGDKNERDPIFNNRNINEKNAEIAKLADNQDIFYIDVNEVVCDENGNLNTEYTIDEIHLKAKYYSIWKQFLLEHGIVR